jgi:hypothetical protein
LRKSRVEINYSDELNIKKDTYTSLADSQRLLAPHLLYSTLQSLEPEIIQVSEPPVSLMLDTDLKLKVKLVNTYILGSKNYSYL